MGMKTLILLILSLVLGGCSVKPTKTEIEISSIPQAKIVIDDKDMGTTSSTYRDNELKPGEITLKLIPEDNNLPAWSTKIRLNNLVTTVVNRKFGSEDKYSSGYVMYMEEIGKNEEATLIVNSVPADAAIAIDGQIKGLSPNRMEQISEGDRQVVISFPGFESQTIFVKMRKGYQVVMDVQLAQKIHEEIEVIEEEKELSVISEKVQILETGTGWLRVRSEPSLSGVEITKVDVGKKYEVIQKESDWYEIKVDEDTSGWISSQYASLVKTEKLRIGETNL